MIKNFFVYLLLLTTFSCEGQKKSPDTIKSDRERNLTYKRLIPPEGQIPEARQQPYPKSIAFIGLDEKKRLFYYIGDEEIVYCTYVELADFVKKHRLKYKQVAFGIHPVSYKLTIKEMHTFKGEIEKIGITRYTFVESDDKYIREIPK